MPTACKFVGAQNPRDTLCRTPTPNPVPRTLTPYPNPSEMLPTPTAHMLGLGVGQATYGGRIARPNLCSRGAQGLRSCDMEYVMLHLIFSLPHAWGGTTHSGTLPLLFDSRDFSVGSSLSPHNDFHFAPRSEIVALCERCS
jgi:hypothetical protein